ncbi:hypothetical protein [Arthrobacter sp. H14]|uniref:hypothetical protein n=1 Tax=Arthrobacter sp. H14 TaxID=1312959 RepID=UPI0004B4B50D|nr:hypothetical protein [Arthrobacter sp. H14]
MSSRAALGWIRHRTDSAKETELRLLLVRAGLPEPSINVAILDERGEWVQDPDMSYQSLRIAMQYDGGHHITEMQRRSDILRDDRAAELDWLVLKYSQLDLKPLGNGEPSAVTKTRRALLDRGWVQHPAA